MRKSIVALSLSCLLVPAAFATPAAAAAQAETLTETALVEATEDSALEAFKASHSKVTEMVDAGAPIDEITTLVDQLLDYDWIATAALGGSSRYAERCEPRCDEFKSLLTKLIRKNYLKRIQKKDEGKVEYLTEHVREKATKVDTRVTFTDPAGETKVVQVDYVMHKVDGKWIVRDIITEGVSLAKNYKYELDKLHAEGGIDRIIKQLEKKLAELDAD